VIRKDLDSLEATCLICLQTAPRQDLDRLLWCDACREAAQARAASRSWYVGLAVAVVLVLWIWFYVQPSNLVIGGWIGTVLGAFYVSARVTREVLYTVARMRSPPAVEAVPPE
jgi:hypothetical protein